MGSFSALEHAMRELIVEGIIPIEVIDDRGVINPRGSQEEAFRSYGGFGVEGDANPYGDIKPLKLLGDTIKDLLLDMLELGEALGLKGPESDLLRD